MPGLLQSPEGKFGSAKVIYAFIAEFLGTLLFTFAGTATPVGSTSTQKGTDTGAGQTAAANWAPWSVQLSGFEMSSVCSANVQRENNHGICCRGNGMSLAVMGKHLAVSIWPKMLKHDAQACSTL